MPAAVDILPVAVDILAAVADMKADTSNCPLKNYAMHCVRDGGANQLRRFPFVPCLAPTRAETIFLMYASPVTAWTITASDRRAHNAIRPISERKRRAGGGRQG
jgi:hypothetical protein